MENIIYREIQKKDYDYIREMMNKNFHLYEYIEDERVLKTFLNSYLYSCLAEKTFSMVAEKNGQTIGVILGKANKIFNISSYILNSVKYLYYIFLTILKSKFYGIDLKQYKGITRIYKELMKKSNKNFEGVLTLFVVSKNFQGYGIGKKLLSYFFDYEKLHNVKNIYLYTDSKCNYKFYDTQGFEKLNEDIFKVKNKNKEFDLQIFLYEYNFKY